MEHYPDAPPGWLALRERMNVAKTPDEVNEVVEEMKKVLDAYEAKMGSGRRSLVRPDLREDGEHSNNL